MRKHPPNPTIVAAALLAVTAVVVALAVTAGTAGSWPAPDTSATGGACQADGTREPITWTVVNRESGYPTFPGYVEQVTLSLPELGTPVFAPSPIPNTGSATASATTDAPADLAAIITLDYVLKWRGPTGLIEDQRSGSATVEIEKCEPPVTTTTTAPPTTTTTEPPTTTTTEPPTTTTTAPPVTYTIPDTPTTTDGPGDTPHSPPPALGSSATVTAPPATPAAPTAAPQFTG